MANFRYNLIHLLHNFITVHHFLIDNLGRLFQFHISYGVVLHSYRFICIKFLSHTLIRLIICIYRLRRETTYNIIEIINNLVVLIYLIWVINFLLLITILIWISFDNKVLFILLLFLLFG